MSDASANRDTQRKPNRKKWVVIIAAVAALAGGAGAATRFLSGSPGNGSDDAAASRKKQPPIFIPLDQFTVNLADEGGERLAQVAVTLEVADDNVGATLKSLMPSVRNTILLLLSSKQTVDLLSVDGKKLLAAQIAQQAGRQLGWQPPAAETDGRSGDADTTVAASGATSPSIGGSNPIEAVHFSHFIVQ